MVSEFADAYLCLVGFLIQLEVNETLKLEDILWRDIKMKELKEMKKQAVKLLPKSVDHYKKLVKQIKKAEAKRELAFLLLDANLAEVFASVFALEHVNWYWGEWNHYDYEKYGITEEDANKFLNQLVEENKAKAIDGMSDLETVMAESDEKIRKFTDDAIQRMGERKKVHQEMIETINRVCQEKLRELEEELKELTAEKKAKEDFLEQLKKK